MQVIRGEFSDEVTFEQRPEGGSGGEKQVQWP